MIFRVLFIFTSLLIKIKGPHWSYVGEIKDIRRSCVLPVHQLDRGDVSPLCTVTKFNWHSSVLQPGNILKWCLHEGSVKVFYLDPSYVGGFKLQTRVSSLVCKASTQLSFLLQYYFKFNQVQILCYNFNVFGVYPYLYTQLYVYINTFFFFLLSYLFQILICYLKQNLLFIIYIFASVMGMSFIKIIMTMNFSFFMFDTSDIVFQKH